MEFDIHIPIAFIFNHKPKPEVAPAPIVNETVAAPPAEQTPPAPIVAPAVVPAPQTTVTPPATPVI